MHTKKKKKKKNAQTDQTSTLRQPKGRVPPTVMSCENRHVTDNIMLDPPPSQHIQTSPGLASGPPRGCLRRRHVHDSIRPSRLHRAPPINHVSKGWNAIDTPTNKQPNIAVTFLPLLAEARRDCEEDHKGEVPFWTHLTEKKDSPSGLKQIPRTNPSCALILCLHSRRGRFQILIWKRMYNERLNTILGRKTF